MITKIKKFIEERKAEKQRIEQIRTESRAARLRLPKEYLNAQQYMRNHCAYFKERHLCNGTDSYPISTHIIFSHPKTQQGLKTLSDLDPRSNEELKDWLRREGQTECLVGRGDQIWETYILTNAVLAKRITSERTLADYVCEGGILGKTFVDWEDPLKPYTVRGIKACCESGSTVIKTNLHDSYCNGDRLMDSRIFDRELKPEE